MEQKFLIARDWRKETKTIEATDAQVQQEFPGAVFLRMHHTRKFMVRRYAVKAADAQTVAQEKDFHLQSADVKRVEPDSTITITIISSPMRNTTICQLPRSAAQMLQIKRDRVLSATFRRVESRTLDGSCGHPTVNLFTSGCFAPFSMTNWLGHPFLNPCFLPPSLALRRTAAALCFAA